jgi:RHS repeat-associated protein
MRTYRGDTLKTTTDYVGGFVYENAALSFFGSPEGRVVKNGTAFEYQYSIADHQGNTRIVFTSAEQVPDTRVATFDGVPYDATNEFQNVNLSNVESSFAANATPGGSKAIRMNQNYKIGPSRSLKVFPGDSVKISVSEYHEGGSGFGTTSTPLTTLISMVSGVFGGSNGAPGEPGLIFEGVNTAISAFFPGQSQGDDRPAAYLNYILFDKHYNVINMGAQVAPDVTFTKQELKFDTVNVLSNIKQEGYVFIYLSYDNDSDNWVYFDDLAVTHTKSNILQYNEYYPFGLQASTSWTRENSSNDYLYNGGSELNQNSGWYETFFRGYDATLGRFNQVDPLAHASSSHTPYNFAFNDPVFFSDPNGDYPQEVYIDMQTSGGGGAVYNYGELGFNSPYFANGGGASAGGGIVGGVWIEVFDDWYVNGKIPIIVTLTFFQSTPIVEGKL